MFADDHNPPHFHIRYGDYDAIYLINKGIIRGEMPVRVVNKVSAWVNLHKNELLSNWDKLQNGNEADSIEPLI
jgi:hypothetical protein